MQRLVSTGYFEPLLQFRSNRVLPLLFTSLREICEYGEAKFYDQ